MIERKCVYLRPIYIFAPIKETDMSIDTYKLTSMDEPADEVLSQQMRD